MRTALVGLLALGACTKHAGNPDLAAYLDLRESLAKAYTTGDTCVQKAENIAAWQQLHSTEYNRLLDKIHRIPTADVPEADQVRGERTKESIADVTNTCAGDAKFVAITTGTKRPVSNPDDERPLDEHDAAAHLDVVKKMAAAYATGTTCQDKAGPVLTWWRTYGDQFQAMERRMQTQWASSPPQWYVDRYHDQFPALETQIQATERECGSTPEFAKRLAHTQ